jgi:pimeloyl-ACP methyl ester carboxylesterase
MRTVSVGQQQVAVWDYGHGDGAPVFAFHGVPASGAGFEWADDPARVRGLHVLAPDRPGIGHSTRVDAWTITDYPAMMAALADALGIDRFGVWGYSGGGPYAAACAATLSDRVTTAVISSGMGQMGVWATAADFAKTDRQFLELAPTHPNRAAFMMRLAGWGARLSPKAAQKSFEKELPGPDAAVIAQFDSPKDTMKMFVEAMAKGPRGIIDDYRAIAQPWGVDLEAITAPVMIFHGDVDPMVPLAHAQTLADSIPHAKLIVWPGGGHLATITHVDEILDVFAS